jgi:hypothetical protein
VSLMIMDNDLEPISAFARRRTEQLISDYASMRGRQCANLEASVASVCCLDAPPRCSSRGQTRANRDSILPSCRSSEQRPDARRYRHR